MTPSEAELEQWLADLIEDNADLVQVWTYEESGMMTRNAGLVVKMGAREF